MRRIALAVLAVATLAGAGCGSEESGNDESAAQLLDRGFATDVDTGAFRLEAEVEVEGGPAEGPFKLELDGPFRVAGLATDVPDLDMTFRASGAGQEYEGRATATRENAWIEFMGETYEAGEELWPRVLEALNEERAGEPRTFDEAGLDPLDWVDDLEENGREQIAGTEATKVTGTVDLEAMLRDVNKVVASGEQLPEDTLDQVDQVVDDVEFEAWIGEDRIWRRISAETEFRIPEDERDGAGGVEGGKVALDVRLEAPNEPVEIEGPTEARPIDELLRSLGVPPESLLGPGFSTPAPG